MSTFFDFIIAIGLIATALPAVILLYHRTKSEKSWEYQHRENSLTLILALFLSAIILFYGSFIEPKMLTVRKQIIDLPKINQPIKIVFFADSQLGPYKQTKHLNQVVDLALKLKPDLVLIGGDMINNNWYDVAAEIGYLEPLQRLAATVPVYAVNGNHEYGINQKIEKEGPIVFYPDASIAVEEKMRAMGVHYLKNNLEKITIKDQSFYLFGGDELWGNNLDYSPLQARAEDIPTIALIHNTAAAKNASQHKIDLMLSGHTHGGQIRLPIIGPLGTVDDVTPHDWYLGLSQVNEMKLFVTAGTGETGARARLFNPPEITLVTIK
jgi:hypothetical protein